jgi:tetratricopeptide (TPR) repeat protein
MAYACTVSEQYSIDIAAQEHERVRAFSKKRAVIHSLLVVTLMAAFDVGCSRDPNVRKQRYFESGQRYLQKGKYPEAVIQFRNALQVDSSYADAHYQLARVYSRMEQWTPAYHELARTVELQPENYPARLDLANLLIAGHQLKEAQEHTDVLLQKDANDPLVHTTYAELLAAQDNLPAAMLEMQKAISLAPDRWESYLTLASLQMNANELDAAEPNFKKAVELNPKAVQSRLAFGRYYQSRGRFPEAEHEMLTAIDADPKDTDPRAALVRLYMVEGKKGEAEQSLKQVRHDFPIDSVGYRMLGDFYFAIGDVDNAIAEYGALYREHPGDVQVKRNYVQLLILKNRFQEADKLNNEMLTASPSDAVALTYRGQIELHDGNTKEAIATLRSAVRSDPGDALAYYHLGMACEEFGDLPQAENAWQNAIRLNPDLSEGYVALARSDLRNNDMRALEQSANQIVRLLPASPAGYAMRAVALIKSGDYKRAEQDANKAISLAPQAPDGYMQLGNVRQAQKNYADAAKCYWETLERDPSSGDALASLMSVYEQEGQIEKALSAAQIQIAKVPTSSAFYDLLGTARFDHRRTEKDLEAAESDLKKSAELDKRNTDALLKLSQVQAARGAIDEAIATSQRALLDNPKQIAFHLLVGRLYEAKHDLDKAKQCYQAALDIDPKSPQAANNMASLLSKTGGNLDVALSLAQTARRSMPDSPNVADTLGWVLYQKGAYRSAIDSFRQALALAEKDRAPDSATLHFHLGMAYQRNGQSALARQQLEKVLKIDPNYSSADDVKRLLEQLRG